MRWSNSGKYRLACPFVGTVRAGEQPVDRIRELFSERYPSLVGSQAAGLARHLRAAKLAARLRNDTDDAQKSAVSIDRRARPPDDFHTFDEIDVDRDRAPLLAFTEDVVIHPVTIDQKQIPGIEVAGAQKPSRSEGRVVAVVRNVISANASQNVLQRSIAEFSDLIRGDDADGCRGLCDFLLILRCGEDGIHPDVHELFQAQILRVRRGRHGRLLGRRPADQNRERSGETEREQPRPCFPDCHRDPTSV